MEAELGTMVSEGPIKGMLIEHDLARTYMSRLETALKNYDQGDQDALLDIIANTIAYTHLLKHHINTEDNTLYPFAERKLKENTIKKLDVEVAKQESTKESQEIREKYIQLAKDLEEKYT